jgi:hypothetical protein
LLRVLLYRLSAFRILRTLLGHGRVFPRGYRCTGKRLPITARWARALLIYTAPGTRPLLGSTDRW